MPKTLSTCRVIGDAALERATAQLNALRAINLQGEMINDMRERFRRREQTELATLERMRIEAEKLGAFDLVAPLAEKGAP